ncbi:MAG: ribonuclease HII [Candidatus Stygibacter frigidus]|nr:ribonuclease HII [Candidatus Stygibacter frigidus]
MLELDKSYFNNYDQITGIDEAGRGPLAGPLVVAAVTFQKDFNIEGLNDSKKLTDRTRRSLYRSIIQEAIDYKIIVISVEVIDEINILQATMLGMQKACLQLKKKGKILIDGNRIPEELIKLQAEAIVKGDQKVSAIAAASILAKVYRDDIMIKLHEKYPEYGFDHNKGYGTKIHLRAIEKYGIIDDHRRSFGPVAQQCIIFD